MTRRDVRVLIQEPLNATFYGKRDFVDGIELMIVRQEGGPGFQGPKSNHCHPYKRGRGRKLLQMRKKVM